MSLLSLQTWHIHSLSIFEWLIAIELIWQYGTLIKVKKFLKLASFMVSFLVSGICIINWHYYSNFSIFIWLVIFQSILTFIGNYSFSRIYS